MMTMRILLVDDDPIICTAVCLILEKNNYQVLVAQSGKEALSLVEKKGIPHLAIIDLHMPQMDGFTLCDKLHQFSDIPIIMLTADDDEKTIVKGIQHHAEDYITKPFRQAELVARIERVLRRQGSFAYTLDPEIFVDETLTINLALRRAYRQDVEIKLTPTEARFLYLLMRFAGRTVETPFLLRRLWPLEDAFEDRLHAVIYRLRRKLEDNPREPRYIVSDWSHGYKFPPPVHPN